MTDNTTLAAPELFAEPFGEELKPEKAAPRYQRRLTDKILAAFTHSYALDEIELANVLFAALRLAEDATRSRHGDAAGSAGRPESRENPGQAVQMAEYWVRLIDARQRYQQVLAGNAASDDPAAVKAHREMSEAYAAWKSQFGPC